MRLNHTSQLLLLAYKSLAIALCLGLSLPHTSGYAAKQVSLFQLLKAKKLTASNPARLQSEMRNFDGLGRILYVEDTSYLRTPAKYAYENMKEDGILPESVIMEIAKNEEVALEMIQSNLPNVIITDLRMLQPNGGLLLATEVRKNHPDTVIIIHTDGLDELAEAVMQAKKEGIINDFVEHKVADRETFLKVFELAETYLSETRLQNKIDVAYLLDNPQQKGTLAMSVRILGELSQKQRDELLSVISGKKAIQLVLYADSSGLDNESLLIRDQFVELPNVVAVPEGRNDALATWGLPGSVAVDLVAGDNDIDLKFTPGNRIKNLKHVRLKELGDIVMAKLVATIPEDQLWWIHEVDGAMETLPGFRSEIRTFIAQQTVAWSA